MNSTRSIRDEAYALCKAVWESPSITDLRNAYQNIHSTWFEYHIRNTEAQFLAYLLLDERLDIVNQMSGEQIPHLFPHERDLLISAHQQVVALDRLCLAPIEAALPPNGAPLYMAALDPYNMFTIALPPSTGTAILLSPEAMDRMAKSFHKHPAISLVLENLHAHALTALDSVKYETAFGAQPEPNLVVQVLDWTRFLTSKGATDANSRLTRLLLFEPKDSLSRPPVRFISAFASLRASLAALNQLVYQATLANKLPVLDNDNIIDIRTTSGIVSRLVDVVLQQSNQLPLVITGQLVRIIVADEVDMLARTESGTMEFADYTIEMVLRELDENLNPFGPLLRNI